MGVVAGSSVSRETDYTLLKIQLFATAHKLNYKKKNQSFQNAADTYTNVITKALDGMADLQMNVSDKAIGSLIMRYNETSWEFAQRMASTFGAPISANVNTEKPLLTVGMPKQERHTMFPMRKSGSVLKVRHLMVEQSLPVRSMYILETRFV